MCDALDNIMCVLYFSEGFSNYVQSNIQQRFWTFASLSIKQIMFFVFFHRWDFSRTKNIIGIWNLDDGMYTGQVCPQIIFEGLINYFSI